MKKRIAKLIAGVFLSAAIFAVGVCAGGNLEVISAYLNHGISVVKDGQVQTMYDAQGNVLTPITYNDSTYLPIRAISNILGHSVEWHPESQCVLLDGSGVPEGLLNQAPKTDIAVPNMAEGEIEVSFLQTLIDRTGNGKLKLDYFEAPPGVLGVYTVVDGVWLGHPWGVSSELGMAFTYENLSVKTVDGAPAQEMAAFENALIDALVGNGYVYVKEDDLGKHYVKGQSEFKVKNTGNTYVSIFGATSWMSCCTLGGPVVIG